MSLHQTHDPASSEDDVYALPISQAELPKRRMPEEVSNPRSVLEVVAGELTLDGNASQNLATFCTTWVEPEVHELMNLCLEKNMIDKDEYPQTAEIEKRCVHILADLWNSPDHATTVGCSTTGSSEACMLAGLALKWRWRQRREAQGKPVGRPNLVCGPVQVCWEKFARYFDVELRQVPLEAEGVGIQAHQLRDYVDENTMGVVAILGVTFTCVYEPVESIAAELDRIHEETGLDVPVHVDAASGGFVAPFLQPDVVWDFRLPRVASINSSGHKYGLAPLGVGWVVWSTPELLPKDLVFNVDYLGGQLPTFALNFSRPAGEIVAQYYNFLRLGRAGYRRVHQSCAKSAAMLAEKVAEMGPFTVLYDGEGALPAAVWRLSDPERAGFTLYDLSDELRRGGWQLPAYPLPPSRQETVVQRGLVRHGMGYDRVALLVEDIRAAAEGLSRGRATGHVEAQPSFHH
ncbi:glutamate decarboxylase [Streptomyces sp. NPDC005438]|uniref:glutamate decarboxylase n=1 Tax=Streptomyces sp. NPDC005438 TaxID=3156880 RepID=UPI0033BF0344